MQQQLTEFELKFGGTVNTSPTIPSREVLLLRARLIFEEAMEFVYAAGCRLNADATAVEIDSASEPCLIAMADATADIHYVATGTNVALGINEKEVFDEVHRSNMSKAWPDGSVKRREDGKIIKPPTYSPADVKGVLARQSEVSTPKPAGIWPTMNPIGPKGSEGAKI